MGKEKKKETNLKKAYIPFMYTLKKKPLTNQFLKRNNPIKEWAKNVNTSQRKKYD